MGHRLLFIYLIHPLNSRLGPHLPFIHPIHPLNSRLGPRPKEHSVSLSLLKRVQHSVSLSIPLSLQTPDDAAQQEDIVIRLREAIDQIRSSFRIVGQLAQIAQGAESLLTEL